MTKPPKKIKIGNIDWAFRYNDEYFSSSTDSLGMCDVLNHVIGVNRGLEPLMEAEIAMHECYHAICWTEGLTDSSTEEAYCSRGSKGWVMLLDRNPHFREYWESLFI